MSENMSRWLVTRRVPVIVGHAHRAATAQRETKFFRRACRTGLRDAHQLLRTRKAM